MHRKALLLLGIVLMGLVFLSKVSSTYALENTNTSLNTIAAGNPSVNYSTLVEGIGWLEPVSDGEMSGTEGQGKQVEAIKVSLEHAPYSGEISYKTHVQDTGWLTGVSEGEISGKTSGNKQVEALQISLTGEMANQYDIYYRVHSEDYGWLGWAKNGASAGTEKLGKQVEGLEVVLVPKGGAAPGSTSNPFLTKPSIVYSTHVETYGWLSFVSDGALSGTEGEAKRLEAIKIDLQNSSTSGGVSYSTHVQDYGWLQNVSDGELSGTAGQSKRLEAIKINLTGDVANHFEVYYRVHTQDYGWLGWAKNGQSAGTQGLAKRLEAVEIVMVPKGEAAPQSANKSFLTKPSVIYSTHVETYGWLPFAADGAMNGTSGQGKRLEAIKINLKNSSNNGDITYSTHVQDYGWISNVSQGGISGTVGQGKRLEAIKINLNGEIEKYFDVYYRVHAQDYGWLGWAKNGMKAGTEGLSKRLEAIEIKLIPKGQGQAVNQKEALRQPVSIFLDPGHGGTDPGAIAGGVYEKNLNFAVAKKVQSLLLNRGYRVYMSRTGDTNLSLLDRAQMANNLATEIFVSIHTNSTAASTTNISGIESYYYEYDPNYPPKINGAMHNDPERVKKSMTLANLVQGNMVKYTGAVNCGTDGDTFAVLRETAMPSTLLEIGFINNPNERQKLVTHSYQNKLALAIAEGIDQYFKIY